MLGAKGMGSRAVCGGQTSPSLLSPRVPKSLSESGLRHWRLLGSVFMPCNFPEVSDLPEERFVDVRWQCSIIDVINPWFHHQRCPVKERTSEGAAPSLPTHPVSSAGCREALSLATYQCRLHPAFNGMALRRCGQPR